MKKILFLINTLKSGGAERVLIDFVNNLDPSKYEITVQTIINDGVYIDFLKPHIRYKTIINEKNKVFRKAKLKMIYNYIPKKRVYKKYIEDSYDIEIAFLEGISTKLISMSGNSESKKIAWIHTDLINNSASENVYNNVSDGMNTYRKFNKIICVSNTVKSSFINLYGESPNLTVIHNIIDSSNIKIKSQEGLNDINKEEFTVIAIGRLVKQKGFDRLLKVHERLIKEGIKHKLLILGDGIEKNNLLNYISSNKLQNSVDMLDYQSNPYKYLTKADLYICSSLVEGYSTVVAEALVLGIPVITTECSGMIDLLGDSEFGLITDNSVESLYDGLKEMIMNKELYNHYKQKAEQRGVIFSVENKIKEYEGLF